MYNCIRTKIEVFKPSSESEIPDPTKSSGSDRIGILTPKTTLIAYKKTDKGHYKKTYNRYFSQKTWY
jgi:hypothetical protein